MKRRESTTVGLPTGFSRGSTIHLVRWKMTLDGWEAEVRSVIYVSRNAADWTVRTDGDVELLARSEWHICEP